MKDAQPSTIYLKDYTPPPFNIERTELCVQLFEDGALVRSTLSLKRHVSAVGTDSPLVLNGEELELRSVSIDGSPLSETEYSVDDESLTITQVSDTFELTTETWIKPQENTRLEGLYKSSTLFCTQCEAEGFRRITYYLDRPDVLSVFTTRVEADKALYPILLSNGNPIESGELGDGRHFVTWEDPFPKPCYLFALVAGDLHEQEADFRTFKGRDVKLKIFVEHKNADKCDYALVCLDKSMRWDEEVYGREYDLDLFMIVAVDDFNMGAMENKGLNIFNSSCVLAKPEAATDFNYQNIEAIIAHEYFHNWSGNRVTCRDWFQLSLKEGFTVFRDSEFSADMLSRPVKRIEDVNLLRNAQFAEDAGPMSHPVRPSSYMEISNFYTLTVYEKGAEVVRMYHTLLGAEKFREGTDLYFDRHDGQAVTTDDFAKAMSDVSGRDLTQFKRWYSQSGTPKVSVSSDYDEQAKQYTLTFNQSCRPGPEPGEKQPYLIPIALGLIAPDGSEIELCADKPLTHGHIFEMEEQSTTLIFEGVEQEPIPSLLRGFSAPVNLEYDYDDESLVFLMAHDSDPFNRWDAGQRFATNMLKRLVLDQQVGRDLEISERYLDAVGSVLSDTELDAAMKVKMLLLPTESYLIQVCDQADVDAIHQARAFVRACIANKHREALLETYHSCLDTGPFSLTFEAMAKRALKNFALNALMASPDGDAIALAKEALAQASNMTDESAALAAIVNSGDRGLAQQSLDAFYDKWKHDAQVIEQWLSLQAGSYVWSDLEQIKSLMAHEAFDITNPNKVRSVIGAFCGQNLAVNFHRKDASGYQFLADQVIDIDSRNPQIASRLLAPFTRWKLIDDARQSMMISELKRIKSSSGLSKDVSEVLIKTLSSVESS